MKLPLLRMKALGKWEFRLREPQRDKQKYQFKEANLNVRQEKQTLIEFEGILLKLNVRGDYIKIARGLAVNKTNNLQRG